jgi:hypothetical protein
MQEDQEGDPGDQHKKWHQKMTVSHDRLHATKKIHLKPFHLISVLSRVSGYVEATLYAIDCPVNNFKTEGIAPVIRKPEATPAWGRTHPSRNTTSDCSVEEARNLQ